jgi:hypothetical protein
MFAFLKCNDSCCYAAGTRLMVAGGPLAYGLRGCYVGVWR